MGGLDENIEHFLVLAMMVVMMMVMAAMIMMMGMS